MIYSLDERKIGTWLDGSDIFQKTIRIEPSDIVDGEYVVEEFNSTVINGEVNFFNATEYISGDFTLPVVSGTTLNELRNSINSNEFVISTFPERGELIVSIPKNYYTYTTLLTIRYIKNN